MTRFTAIILGMRAPGWLRDSFEWRWAPCVALVASALLFVVLALLLIPAQLDGASRATQAPNALERPSPQRGRAQLGASLAREPTHIGEGAGSERSPDSSRAAPPRPQVPPSPDPPVPAALPATPEPAVAAAAQLDFGANIADRGDRPERPAASRR